MGFVKLDESFLSEGIVRVNEIADVIDALSVWIVAVALTFWGAYYSVLLFVGRNIRQNSSWSRLRVAWFQITHLWARIRRNVKTLKRKLRLESDAIGGKVSRFIISLLSRSRAARHSRVMGALAWSGKILWSTLKAVNAFETIIKYLRLLFELLGAIGYSPRANRALA